MRVVAIDTDINHNRNLYYSYRGWWIGNKECNKENGRKRARVVKLKRKTECQREWNIFPSLRVFIQIKVNLTNCPLSKLS